MKDIKLKPFLSVKTSNSQLSERLTQNEKQKLISKEMKDMCNTDNSIKKIDETECRIVDDIKN